MDKGTKKALLVGGVVVAGAAFWYFFFGPGSTSSAAATTTTTESDTSSATTLPWYAAANAAEVSTIQGWINTMGVGSASYNNWTNYFQTAGTQTDINNMYTIIADYWNVNQTPPGALSNYFTTLSTRING